MGIEENAVKSWKSDPCPNAAYVLL